MKKFIAFAVALLSVLGATAQPFLTTKGGDYQKVSSYTQLQDDDIVIAASHYNQDGTDKVYVMTTAAADNAGRFGSYSTDIPYDNNMPDTIIQAEVNKDNYPWEYAVKYNSKQGTKTRSVSLQDKNGQYVVSGTTTKSMSLGNVMYWTVNEDGRVIDEDNRQIRYNSGYFFNSGTTSEKVAYLYRKIYQLSIGAEGYATLYYGSNDVMLPKGLKAYTYEFNGDKLSPATTYDGDKREIVPHATAVIVKGTPNTVYTLDVKNTQKTSGSSVLRGSDDAVSTKLDGDAAGSKYYMFGKGNDGLGFYYAKADGSAFVNSEHRAYLCLNSTLVAKGFTLVLPDGTNIPTGVGPVNGAREASADGKSAAWYDLSGRQVERNAKGLYIHKGKVIAY